MKSATSFAVFTAFAVSSIEALLPPSVGVCYVPWRLQSITWETLQADMSQISKYFKHIRTFELSFGDYNAIDVAAAANLYIDPTVQLGNPAKIDSEINAFCEGYKRNRWAVKTVYVGNENLRNGGFGQYTVNELLGYIQRVRNCVDPSQTSVGTVQRITEWVTAPDAMILASNCDVIGVNIYPFFTISQETSIQKLQSQWNSMISMYDPAKVRLTETGYPSAGDNFESNTPSLQAMEEYFQAFIQWSMDKPVSYWFIMYDSYVSYSGRNFEMYFGLFDVNGRQKFQF